MSDTEEEEEEEEEEVCLFCQRRTTEIENDHLLSPCERCHALAHESCLAVYWQTSKEACCYCAQCRAVIPMMAEAYMERLMLAVVERTCKLSTIKSDPEIRNKMKDGFRILLASPWPTFSHSFCWKNTLLVSCRMIPKGTGNQGFTTEFSTKAVVQFYEEKEEGRTIQCLFMLKAST